METENKYCGLLRRFFADAIDLFLVIILIITMSLYSPGTRFSFLFYYSLGMLIALLYPILSHHFYGQTLGKKLLGIKLYSITGLPIGLKEALLRSIGEIFLTLVAIISTYVALTQIPEKDVSKVVVSIFNYTSNTEYYNNFLEADPTYHLRIILITLWYYVGLCFVFFDRKKRSLQDHIARTILLKIS